MLVKMLKALDGYKVDDVVDLEDVDGQKYIDDGNAELSDAEEVDAEEMLKTLLSAKVEDAVAKSIKALAKDEAGKTSIIDVGIDKSALDPRGGYKNAAEFLTDIYRAGKNPHVAPSAKLMDWQKSVKTAGHMAEGDDSQGGFLVPTQFIADLKMNKLIDNGIPGMCTTIPMATNSVSIPYVAETTHATSVYGGVIVYRTGEAAQKTASKPTLGLCTLTLHKLTAFTYITDELIEDSAISLSPILGNMFPEALNFVLEDDLLNGTGAGMGLGVIPAPATITVARAGAGAIARADVLNMYRRMYPRSLGNAVWFANQDTMGQFMVLNQAVGTAGGQMTWLPPNGDAAAPYGTILGRPVYFIELAQTLGTAGDLIFADLSQMFLGKKPNAAIKFESSIHLRFDYDEVAFRSELRYDCQPWWASPLTPRYATETLSPFVILGDAATTTTTSGQ